MLSKKNRLILIMLLCVVSAHAQITSTFDTDADGWTCSDNNLASPLTVTYNSTGGNPDGYISTSTTSSQPFFWVSPAKFGGNIAYFSYGQELSFDIQLNHVGTVHGASSLGDVQIRIPSGQVLVINLPTFPAQAPAWSSFTIKLDETAGWRVGNTGGTLATQAQMLQYLSGVHSFRFSAKYTASSTVGGAIDNVRLNKRSILPTPIISSFSPTSGKTGTSITINGSNFDPVASNNVVFFGAQAGTITDASTNSLTVSVPPGATYGNITVINKTTGHAQPSSQPFVPTFDGGGRIIPASFHPKFDITITGGYGGHSIADMDGDGRIDLVVARQDNSGIWIYLNLSEGGPLSASSFAAPVNFPTLLSGTNGSGLKVIDLDNDGKLDMVTSGWTGGPGAFATFKNISTPGNLAFEAVEHWNGRSDESPVYTAADIDGDGLPELISGEGSGGAGQNVWITQNMSTPGNIMFGYSLLYFPATLDDAPSGATIADLDNDGKPEFILVHNFSGLFSIIPNTSTPGTISLGTAITFTESIGGSINVADFNLDGKNDLAWKNGFSNDDVHIRINTNSGAALTASDFATEFILNSEVSTYGSVTLADINGDGKTDILATDNADVGIFENAYTGGTFDARAFIPAYRFQGNGGSTYPSGALAGDLNGDSKPDIVIGVTNTSPNRLSIYENKNVHAPVISVNTVSPLKGSVGSTVTITGSNFSPVPSENTVYFGAVQGTVLTATPTKLTVSVPAGATYAPVSVRKGELTSRYRLPFVTTFSPGVTFDNTHFAPPLNFTLTNANYDIEVGDLNRDGLPDILAEGTGGFIFRNTHTTGALNSGSLLPDDTLSNSFVNPRLEDFDGDGLPDAAAANGLAHKNNSTSTEINFQPAISLGIGAGTMDIADFNTDGKMDIAVTADASGLNDLQILENRTANLTGNFITGTYGSFSQEFFYTKPAPFGGIVTEDLDGDGFPDIVTTNPTLDNISIYSNAGLLKISASQFATRIEIAAGDNPGRIYKGDFDADGKVDLLLYHGTGTNSTLLIIFHNTSTAGNISFNRIDLTNPSATTVATIADLDGDGKPEIISTSEAGNRFSIFKNIHSSGPLTASSFAAPFNTTVTAPRGITTGDLNLDGKPEIIITRAAGLLVVYENLVPTGPTITITTDPSPSAVCDGNNSSLTINASGTTNLTYQWQKFNTLDFSFNAISDGGGYTGTTTSTLTINTTGNFGAGDYRCKVSGDLASDVFSATITVTVNPLPSPPATTGATNCMPAALTLSASGGTDGQYRWYTGSVDNALATEEPNSTFTTPMLTVTTTYYVSINDGSCESTRTPVTASINLLAKPILAASKPVAGGAITMCAGESCTLTAPSGFSAYAWSDGAITPQITVTASGVYAFTVTDAAGCVSPSSDPVTITVNPFPEAAITVSGTQLNASPGDRYQWFESGNILPSATSQSFTFNALEYGAYAVEVTTNGCTTRSADFIYLITANELQQAGWKVYPNPFATELTIELPLSREAEVRLVDVRGRSVRKLKMISTTTLSLDKLPQGTYFLAIRSDRDFFYVRVIKTY